MKMSCFRFKKRKNADNSAQKDTIKVEKPGKKRTKSFEKFKNACKKMMAFLFSRIGLCFLVMGYAVIGGFIFKSIEGKYEDEKLKNRSAIEDLVNFKTDMLVYEIWNMTKYQIIFHERNYTKKLKLKILEYQRNITHETNKDPNNQKSNTNIKWTYSNSILYAITITTTIGYGHVTCETDTGKIATMLYALIGVPMMLLCLTNIGSSMANLFRFVYAKVCCGYCNYVKKRNIRMKAAALSTTAVTHANAISFAALTSANFLFNNESEANGDSELNVDGKNITPDVNNFLEGNNKSAFTKQDEKILPSGHEPELIEIFDENDSTDYQKITIPISATLTLFSSYLFFGGFVFKTLEGWTLLDGIYFCFITLTTIGLGDYVPGNSINDSDTQTEVKLIGLSLYLLLGLSFITMGFNLMQEEATSKFKRLAVRLGIINDPNLW